MKVVYNDSYGGFHIPKLVCDISGIADDWDTSKVARTNPIFINWLENNRDKRGSLSLVYIPDEATDWIVFEYDGAETVYYVLDGKIRYAHDIFYDSEEEECDDD